MKHIAFAVIAAAALAVIGPRISQGRSQPGEAAPHELFAPSDYRATPGSPAAPDIKETERVRQ
jgi:hypothetical protein